MDTADDTLEREIATYRRELTNLLPYLGQWVVIYGDQVLGIYRCHHDAGLIGCEKLGTETPFLLRQISAEEEVIHSLYDPELFR